MEVDPRRLRQVRAIAEHGGYSKAAQTLGVTQPALTRSIQALEAELGARIFDRGRRGAEPTALGRLLLAHAERAEALASDFKRDLALAKGAEIGKLQLGVGPWGGMALAGPAIGKLIGELPRLRVALSVVPAYEAAQALHRRAIDLWVGGVTRFETMPSFEVLRLRHWRTYVVCRSEHPLTRVRSPTFADMTSFSIAGPPLDPHDLSQLRGIFAGELRHLLDRAEGVLPVSCPLSATIKDILRHSDLVCVMPYFMVREEVARGELVLLPQPVIDLEGDYGAVWTKGRTRSPPEQALIDALVVLDLENARREKDALSTARGGRRARSTPATSAPALPERPPRAARRTR
jgi:DNA-binding transcriptional LysR family regulator